MLNQVQLIGRVGKDPEVRYLPNGDPVVNLSIATSEKWKDKATGETKEATEWHRINAFGKLAEIIGQYVKKGSLVFVQGKIMTRKWADQSGQEKYSTEIRIDTLKMLGDKKEGGATQPSQQDASGSQFPDDDIPF